MHYFVLLMNRNEILTLIAFVDKTRDLFEKKLIHMIQIVIGKYFLI